MAQQSFAGSIANCQEVDYFTTLDPVRDVMATQGLRAGRVAFVTTLYREQLDRFPEPGGLRYWTRKLAAGMRPRTVAVAIWRSREHRSLVKQHINLYVSIQRSYHDALHAGHLTTRFHAALLSPPLVLASNLRRSSQSLRH